MSREPMEKILERVANIEAVKNFEISVDEDALRGDGFLGEFYTGSVKNKDTGEIIQTYVKRMPATHPGPYGPSAFFNETHFYLNIWPHISKFQQEKGLKNPFQNIPRIYCTSSEPGNEYISMENLKVQNFNILDKSQSIDQHILKTIFVNYGKYHALTFSFKDQNLEKYTELVSPLKDVYVEFGDVNSNYLPALTNSFTAAYKALKEIDEGTAQKVEPYVNKITENYHRIQVYDGKFSALVHGDCWSNNMLFKFGEDGTLQDMKLIDFQLCRDSTPIHDLSYFFYSGASKEDFSKIDEYLELYHKSFSAFAKELGSDPEKLLPLSALKSEWKTHSLLGIFMGILLWQVKLTDKDKIEEMTTRKSREESGNIFKLILESEIFKKNTSDILFHAVEYGIL